MQDNHARRQDAAKKIETPIPEIGIGTVIRQRESK